MCESSQERCGNINLLDIIFSVVHSTIYWRLHIHQEYYNTADSRHDLLCAVCYFQSRCNLHRFLVDVVHSLMFWIVWLTRTKHCIPACFEMRLITKYCIPAANSFKHSGTWDWPSLLPVRCSTGRPRCFSRFQVRPYCPLQPRTWPPMWQSWFHPQVQEQIARWQ